jgi:HK97 family phage portal protein
MNIREKVRGALRRIAGVSLGDAIAVEAGRSRSLAMGSSAGGEKRRTLALPSILSTFGYSRAGLQWAQAMPKPTPANLRRFAETPVARKAINTIKDRIAGMKWRVQARRGRLLAELPDGAARVRMLTDIFEQPNPDDSFRSLAEQVLEDVIVGGFGAIEVQDSGDPGKPLVLWPVDGATIRIKADWDGNADSVRYVQATQEFGPAGQIELKDEELTYIRLNARTHTPFGLGRLEVAFETVNSFLSAHRYASRLASNSVVQYALWLKDLSPAHHERLIRWWQDEIEGTGKVPILSVENKPEVLRFGGGTDADLRLAWQEFLLRVIADAFDLPPQYLGVERDVNRSTATEMNDIAFQHAIVPTARLLAEHLTREAIGKRLGWNDLEFVFTELDAQNELEQAQIDEILLRSGVMTVNEVRQMRGLPELGSEESS